VQEVLVLEIHKALDPDRPGLLFYRLALTIKQASDLGVLDADDKAETDVIPVPVLDRWLRDAIEALQDPTGRERLRELEGQERERLPDAIRAALEDLDT
jgi:hypothetical protein